MNSSAFLRRRLPHTMDTVLRHQIDSFHHIIHSFPSAAAIDTLSLMPQRR